MLVWVSASSPVGSQGIVSPRPIDAVERGVFPSRALRMTVASSADVPSRIAESTSARVLTSCGGTPLMMSCTAAIFASRAALMCSETTCFSTCGPVGAGSASLAALFPEHHSAWPCSVWWHRMMTCVDVFWPELSQVSLL